MVFKNLCCLLPNKQGEMCNKHLGDLQAGVEVTLRFTCGRKHKAGSTDKIEFSQDSRGTITWRPIPMKEKKRYDDDGVRIGISDDIAEMDQ